jgi:hypothetical protein
VAAHAGSALTTADTLFIPLPVFHVFGLTGLLLGPAADTSAVVLKLSSGRF